VKRLVCAFIPLCQASGAFVDPQSSTGVRWCSPTLRNMHQGNIGMQLRLRPQSEEDDSTKGHGLFPLQVRAAWCILFPRSVQPCVFRRDKKVTSPSNIFSLISPSFQRCDGAKPICTSCKKSPRRPDCHYEDVPRFQPGRTESTVVKRGESSRRPKMTKSTKATVSAAHLDYAYWCGRIHDSKSWTAPIPHLVYDFWTSDPAAFQLSAISTDDRNMML
jgi:hypothetical protein